MQPKPGQSPHEFWNDFYRGVSHQTDGRPSAVLEQFVADRTPGRALDLGCAKGDDAIWLARRAWDVVAVDIAQAALDIAQANAANRGAAARIKFECHDLAKSCPEGPFDLISAMFLQTPFDFPRRSIFARAHQQLAPGGLLLVVKHGSAAPWSWSKEGARYPLPEEDLTELGVSPLDAQVSFVGALRRTAHGPDGQTAEVLDNVIALVGE